MMKQTITSDTNKDLSVYDFNEEDELPDNHSQWSKFTNPNDKYHFLHQATAASNTQMKEGRSVEQAHVVAVDDEEDDHGFINGITHGSLGLLESVGTKLKEGLDIISGRSFQQHCHSSIEDGIGTKSSSPSMEIKVSNPFRSPSGDALNCSPIPESPSNDSSADAGTPDGRGSIKQSSLSPPASPLDQNYVVGRDLQEEEDQPDNGLEMDEMDIVHLAADYVFYRDQYFPASFILISKQSIIMKGSSLEEQSGEFSSEWDINDVISIECRWSSVGGVADVRVCLCPKDPPPKENTQGAPEVLEFLVHDTDWLQRQEYIMSLNRRYEAVWSTEVNGKNYRDAFALEMSECSDPFIPVFEEPFEEVIYPKGDVDAVSISKRDVDLLLPDIFINDTIIDFYTKYIKNTIWPDERHRFHFFNSFFFRKLADLDKNPSSAFDSKAAFQRVRKWTRKVNIFDKDYIFIPVNYNLHWSLIVICHPGEVANVRDENMDESLKVPCILHMDSIRGSHTGLKDIIQSYLLEEWKERQKESSKEIDSKFLNLRFLSLELPQQENCSDCGLFLLHYTELFVAEAPVNFSPFIINKYENFLKPDWFVPAEASLKRVHIQKLIYSLLEDHSQGSASPCSDHELFPSAMPKSNENDNVEIICEGRNPGKSWNGNISFSNSVQGMNMGLLDESLYGASQCVNESGLVMRDLLQGCQQYDEAASFEQIREGMMEAAGHDLACSTLGQGGIQPLDGMVSGACHAGFSSGDFREVFFGNSELCNEEDPNGNLSPTSNHSSDDSEEMTILECEPETRGGANSSANESKENVDNLTESYASASSDMMETPAEDSQELDQSYGNIHVEESIPSESKEVDQVSQQERLNENREFSSVDEKLVAEDSSSDLDEQQVQVAKRRRLTPSLDDETQGLGTTVSEDNVSV